MLQASITLQMIEAKNILNRHEIDIFQAIEKEEPHGINVRGLTGKKYGFSPPTVIKYLSTLENQHRFIYSEKIKNSRVYHIRKGQEMTHAETQEFVKSSISDIEKLVNSAMDKSKKRSIAEQMEVYHQVVNVLVLHRYIKKFLNDISKEQTLSDEMNKFFDQIDEITKKINLKVNLILSPLIILPLIHTLDESMINLEKITKGKKIRKSKFIKKIEPEIKEVIKEAHSKLKKLDDEGFFDNVKTK